MNASPPIRVLVDLGGMLGGGQGGGITPVLLAMLRWLATHGADRLHFVYAANAETRTEVESLARPMDTVIEVSTASSETAALLGCNLVYCPFGVTDLACPGIPTITLVVDLLHRDFPGTLREPDRLYREQKFVAAIAASDRIQVISDYTAARLNAHYQVPGDRVFRTYQPIHERLLAIASPPDLGSLSRPFFFYAANFWVHKNHEVLLQAYAHYRGIAGAAAWPLVLVGHIDENRLAMLQKMTGALNIEQDVRFPGYVADTELAGYYRAAGALLFPSLYEGFGVPLLEAMAFGIPIIASNTSSIPEIAGTAALLVDARDFTALSTAMGQIASEAGLRAKLVSCGREQLKKFSPEVEYGRLLEEFFRTVQIPSRLRSSGYHREDGLTDPVALFVLPTTTGEITLDVLTRPLPAIRTLQVFCGRDLIFERIIPAAQTAAVTVTFNPKTRVLALRVPDASSLSVTDPRTHGVLLEEFRIRTSDGLSHDLLASDVLRPAATKPPNSSVPGYLWHTETELPSWSQDGCLEIRGWCYRQGGQSVGLRLKIADMDWPVLVNLPRPDVNWVYPRLEGKAYGFVIRVRAPAGGHELRIEHDEASATNVPFVKHELTVSFLAPLTRFRSRNTYHLLAFQIMVGPYYAPRPIKCGRFPRPAKGRLPRPRIAIATPSFQQKRFLEQTMRSVLQQDIPGEYVVQDGGSTDGSAALIQGLAEEYRGNGKMQLTSWESSPDEGQANAIIKGLSRTTGGPNDIMGWINSDDFYMPGALAFVADYFAQHPDVDVLYGNRILVDDQSREIGRWFLPDHDDHVLLLNDFVPQETLFWRRRIWESVGGLDPSFQYAMDWDLLLRFQAAGARIVHVPYFLACFRLHIQQKTAALYHTVGRTEIERLHIRSLGRALSTDDLLNDPRLIRYLKCSAKLELLGSFGWRSR